MIKVLLVDVGGTLIRPEPSVGEVYSRVAARHGVQATPADLESRFAAAWSRQKKRTVPMSKTFWRDVVRESFGGLPFHDFNTFFEDLHSEFARAEAWHVFPDVRPALEALRVRGIRMAIASNWDDRLPPLLEALRLTPFFETMVVSGIDLIAKPNPDFFHMALRRLGVAAEEAAHVGDDPVEDFDAARAAGLRAYLIDRRGGRPDSLTTLAALPELVGAPE